jgi:serine/threonine protein kinase
MEQQNPLIGTIIQNRYQILRLIGEGGMGVVYEGKHLTIERQVAIKLIHSSFAKDSESVGRFYREAKAAASARNEHIVEVFDMDVLPDGSPFMVQEYLEGCDLGKLIENVGPLPLGRVVRIVVQICDALDAVHAAGIIHRDLKPENIFLVSRGANPDFVKIMDFGISKIKTSWVENSTVLTVPGTTIGTPLFMAPEQIVGSADVDRRADIFALGGLLYYSLTANYPFSGETLYEIWENICNELSTPVRRLRPDLPSDVEGIIGKALEKERDDRYSSCTELKAALWPYLDQSPELVTVVPYGLSSIDGALVRKRKRFVPVWLGGAGLAASVVLTSFYFASQSPSDEKVNTTQSAIRAVNTNQTPVSDPNQNLGTERADAATVKVSILAIPHDAKVFLDERPIENPRSENLPLSHDVHQVKAVLAGQTEIRDFVANKDVSVRIDFNHKRAFRFQNNRLKNSPKLSGIGIVGQQTGPITQTESQPFTIVEPVIEKDSKTGTDIGAGVSSTTEKRQSANDSKEDADLASSRRNPILIREE